VLIIEIYALRGHLLLLHGCESVITAMVVTTQVPCGKQRIHQVLQCLLKTP
jgi:hypothetical protein